MIASPSALEPLPTQPLESLLSALSRAPLMPFDATGRMAAATPLPSTTIWNSSTPPAA